VCIFRCYAGTGKTPFNALRDVENISNKVGNNRGRKMLCCFASVTTHSGGDLAGVGATDRKIARLLLQAV
jgi:hypothetical protein